MADGSSPKSKRMTVDDLATMLSAQYAAALGGNKSSELSDEREKALDYYNGDMTDDMPTTAGRSSAVSMDVQETVEGLMPGMMEIFAAGDDVVKFNPVGPEDEDGADQETDYTNHVLMQKNPGFLIIYSFIKDALLSKLGIVKIFWDEYEKQSRETYDDQPDDVYAILAADPDIEIIEHTEHPDENWQPQPVDPMAPQQAPQTAPMVHDITVLTKTTIGCARVENVPPEEFGIGRGCRSLPNANYTYHRSRQIVADLIAQGFDEDEVNDLPVASAADASTEEIARDTVGEESNIGSSDESNDSSRYVEIVEEYCMCDYDGTGKPAMYRITRGGGTGKVLTQNGKPAVEAVDEHPFAGMTPIIMTHRVFGKSIADLVLDIQKIKTAIFRGLLDNLYLSNNNRTYVAETLASDRTIDDLLINRPGGIVRGKAPGAVEVMQSSPIGPFAFPLMEFVDQSKEFRTGVSKLGAGQDPNVLQNTTALATEKAFSATQEKRNLIARIFAETGIKDMMLKLHGVIRKNDRKENTVKLRNKWVQVNPREWTERNDMTANVGLGTGSKHEKLQGLLMLAEQQKQALAFPQFGLVKPKHLYNTAKQITKLLDLKNTDLYFQDPESPEAQAAQQQQQPPPDPNMVKAQGQLQIMGQKAQADTQLAQTKAAADLKLQAGKHQADSQVATQKAQADAALHAAQMTMEERLAIRQQDIDAQLEREKLQLERDQMQVNAALGIHANTMNAHSKIAIAKVKPGGKVG